MLLGIMILSTTGLLVNSCIDPMYDMAQGINTEIQVGGDSLALPIGTTDTMRLGDFLNSNDLEFLKTMEDGGYSINISDSVTLDDLLRDVDVSKLKFDDKTFSQITKIDFGDIDISDFSIPDFNKTQVTDMNIPLIEIGNIVPTVDLNTNFNIGFSDYALNANELELDAIDRQSNKDNLLANSYPFNTFPGEMDNPTSVSFDLPDIPLDGIPAVTINYEIDVPDGVVNIHQIDLEAGGTLEIKVELGDVQQSIQGGIFTPNITVDPSDLFVFDPFAPLTGGKIVFTEELNDFNLFTSTKTLTVDAFHNLPTAVNGLINLSKDVNVSGSISAKGDVKPHKIQSAKEIDLIVHVKLTNLKIKNMDFDIPTFTSNLTDQSNFVIFDNTMPVEIKKILSLHLEKTPGTTYNENLIIHVTTDPDDLPPLTNSNYQIDNLVITFPDNCIFDENTPNLSGNVYSVQNIPFDTEKGYLIELNLKEVNLEDTPIINQTLEWSGEVSYTGQISINGRANSKDINTSIDPAINLKFETAVQLNHATVVTNPIKEDIEDTPVALEYEINISENVRRLGIVNLESGCKLRIDIMQPDLPLPLEGDEIVLRFSDLYMFYPHDHLNDNNEYHIKGAIPEYIELELQAFRINRDLDEGYLSLKDTFYITGSILLTEGIVNSTAISSLEDKNLTFKASVSNMNITATSIEMNTLVAHNVDSTSMEMEIEDIPSQIIALDSILFKDGGEMELEMVFNNMPDLGDSLLHAYMILKFPDMLILEPGITNDKNELIIDEPFDRNNQLIKKINVKGFKFDASELSGKLTVNDKVRFDVDISVNNPTINTEDLQGENITADVIIKLKGLEFKSVYGKVDIDLGDQMKIPNVPLDNFPEFMRNKDAVLDVLNPILALKTESNLGIPFDTKLSLTKFIDGNALTDEKISLNFSLPKVNSPDEIIQTGYWYAPKKSGMPNNYTFTETHLQNLFKPVPDSVLVEFVPRINTDAQHIIDLDADYTLKVKYDIIIPLSFGKDLNILLRDTIENVILELGDLNLKTGALEILATITNSIPLDLDMDLIMMDANNKILATSSEQKILAGASDGSGVESDIKIKLADNLEKLKDLNKVALVFKASSNETVAGTPIKPTNFIKASLKARVLGGINITL